jgi:hypothetical protein
MRSQHNQEAQPYFLSDFEKLPRIEDNWTTKRTPATHFTIRIKSVRFQDGYSKRYYLQIPKPVSKREQNSMRMRAQQLLDSLHTDNDRRALARKNAATRTPAKPRGRRKKGLKVQ